MRHWVYLSLAVFALGEGLPGPQAASAQEAKRVDLYKTALAQAQAGKLAEAEGSLDRLLAEENDQITQVLMFRANLRANLGRFQDAAGDLEQVIKINPSEHGPWFILTPLLVQTGQIAKYRTHCKEMLHRFNDTTDGSVAERVAKSCLLVPSALDSEDSILAANLADNSVALSKEGEFWPWRRMTKGLADYRRGRFASAVETMDRVQKDMSQAEHAGREAPSFGACKADICFISAMAHHQLKETDKARAALDQGHEIVRTQLPSLDDKNLGPSWWDTLMTYILMAEASATVEGSRPAHP